MKSYRRSIKTGEENKATNTISVTPPPVSYIGEPSEKDNRLAERIHNEILSRSPSGEILLQREELRQKASNEMSLDDLANILDTTIKEDRINKLILFLGYLLNYTAEDQQNIAFNAPSSTGKSYLALEVAKYFPDVMDQGYTSPRAFFWESSVLFTEEGQPLEPLNAYLTNGLKKWEENNPYPAKGQGRSKWGEAKTEETRRLRNEWDEIGKLYIIDLCQKIIIFVDQPHDELLKVIRSLLSHDKKRLNIKIVDKSDSGNNKTRNIVIEGYPTMVFCSAAFSLDEQEQTRFWLLSPEMRQEKFKASIELQSLHLSNRPLFNRIMNDDEERQRLRDRVSAIKLEGINEVLIDDEERKQLLDKFLKEHPDLTSRHQRDFPRLIALIKAHALLNCFTRKRSEDGKAIWVTATDLEKGLELIKSVAESNEMGLPPYIYQFWVECLKPKLCLYGLTRQQVAALYHTFWKQLLGERGLKSLIRLLSEVGLVYEEPDPNDKRLKKVYATGGGVEELIPISEDDLCKDCKKPLTTENLSLWKGKIRLCIGCARARSRKLKDLGPDAGEGEEVV